MSDVIGMKINILNVNYRGVINIQSFLKWFIIFS
jgi:hypothetical protein